MTWVLNIKKGTTVNHPEVGQLESGIAYEIDDHYIPQLKNIRNLVIFDMVVPIKSVKKE